MIHAKWLWLVGPLVIVTLLIGNAIGREARLPDCDPIVAEALAYFIERGVGPNIDRKYLKTILGGRPDPRSSEAKQQLFDEFFKEDGSIRSDEKAWVDVRREVLAPSLYLHAGEPLCTLIPLEFVESIRFPGENDTWELFSIRVDGTPGSRTGQ